jgi:hypothetical protein
MLMPGSPRHMLMPGSHGAILERIGRTIAEIDEDLADEPIPARIGEILDHDADFQDTSILCSLIDALTRPEDFEFVRRNGELFLVPRGRSTG